jgi:hypothetical protein
VRDKKEPKSASADGCPAKLTARLGRYVQTAAGEMKNCLWPARRWRVQVGLGLLVVFGL